MYYMNNVLAVIPAYNEEEGTADVFLYILHRVAERQPVLVRRQPAQPLRDAPRPEPLHPAVQLVHELPDRGAAPVAGAAVMWLMWLY